MKKIFTSLMSLALVASLTACSGGSTAKTSQTASGSAGSGNSITVYSPHPAETINLLVQEFENKTGIKVDIVSIMQRTIPGQEKALCRWFFFTTQTLYLMKMP